MDSIPPVTMTPAEMKAAYPGLTTKMEMVALRDAVYVRHMGQWWLLDAEKHGHAPAPERS